LELSASFLSDFFYVKIRRKNGGGPIASKGANQQREKAAESPSQAPSPREVVAARALEVFHSWLSCGICRENLLLDHVEKTLAEMLKAAGGPCPRLWCLGAGCLL